MSAWLCTTHHIDALVNAALPSAGHSLYYHFNGESIQVRTEDADRIGLMLLTENVRSLHHRYPDDEPDELPGPNDKSAHHAYKFRLPADFTPVQLLKALASYEYQSCEHHDYYESEAHAFCDALRGRLIHRLPGWEEADTWEIEEEGRPNRILLSQLARSPRPTSPLPPNA